jgi:hypothetical protein
MQGMTGGGAGGSQWFGGSGGPFSSSGGGTGPFVPLEATNDTRFQGAQGNAWGAIRAAGKGLANAAIDAAAFLPSSQEALNSQQLAERMRFYSNNLNSPTGNKLSTVNNIPLYQYDIMNQASRQGTVTTSQDILSAVNMGSQAGLMPGLSNYNAGAPGAKTGFSGILGGAALASNLTPGIGITGGMGVMANINQAHNVNMLKMIGIQTRNAKGTSMTDLPQIIQQLYDLLTRGNKDITPEDLAVSLMPGNALDSLINQYFGGDATTKSVVVAGLTQLVKVRHSNSGADLRTAGTKEALGLTGGTLTAMSSTSSRNTQEQQLIQQYSSVTNEALVGTNNVLQGMYSILGKGANHATMRELQRISTGLTTFAGARGGAGGMALADAANGIGTLGSGIAGFFGHTGGFTQRHSGSIGKILGLGAIGAGAAAMTNFDNSTANAPSDPGYNVTTPTSTPAQLGPQFTGAITINVSAPPGSDPYAYSAAFLDAFK